MIIVTGATGQLGRAIVERLVRRLPPAEVGASARDPDKIADLARFGVRVRKGDFAQPEGLAHAFEGAAQVLVVSSNAAAHGGDTIAQHRAAITAARAAGARRVVYTSHMAASASSAFPPSRTHATTEGMLAESGLRWTSLRHGFYATSGVTMMRDALESGVHEAPADGKVAWTAHADLAEAAAILLTDEGRFEGPTPPLVGAETLDFADLARIASEILDRPIRRAVVSDDALRARLGTRGLPPAVADIALGYYRASREGEFANSDTTLANLLGRAPTPMRSVMERMLAR